MKFRSSIGLPIAAALLSSIAAILWAAVEERLILPPHPGWGQWKVITDQRSPDRIFVERIPETQSVDSMEDLVVEQFYRGVQDKISPVDFLRALPRFAQTSNCEKVRATQPVGAIERGYNVAYAQMYCPQQKGKPYGFVDLQKVIQGKNGLYVIQREWRLKAFNFVDSKTGGTAFIPQEAFGSPEKATAWFDSLRISNEYLVNNVFLCGSRESKTPCP